MRIEIRIVSTEEPDGFWGANVEVHAIRPPASGPGWAHGEISVGSFVILQTGGFATQAEAETQAFEMLVRKLRA